MSAFCLSAQAQYPTNRRMANLGRYSKRLQNGAPHSFQSHSLGLLTFCSLFHHLQCLLIRSSLAAQGTHTMSDPFSSRACLCTQIGHSLGAFFSQYRFSALENMSACTLFSSMSLYNFFREFLLTPQKLSTGSSCM